MQEEEANNSWPAKHLRRGCFGTLVVIQAFLVVGSLLVLYSLTLGSNITVLLELLIILSLGGIGDWVIIRNGRGLCRPPLWVGGLLAVIPFIPPAALLTVFSLLFLEL